MEGKLYITSLFHSIMEIPKWPNRLVIVRHGQSQQNIALDLFQEGESAERSDASNGAPVLTAANQSRLLQHPDVFHDSETRQGWKRRRQVTCRAFLHSKQIQDLSTRRIGQGPEDATPRRSEPNRTRTD